MKFLLITENRDLKQFFQSFCNKEQSELILIDNLGEISLHEFNFAVIDATSENFNVSEYFRQKKISGFELKKIFIILENISLATEFINLGIYNFLFKPFDEHIIRLQFSKAEKELDYVKELISKNKKNEKNIAKLEKTLSLKK